MPRTPVTTALIVMNVLAFVFEITRVGSNLIVGGGTLDGLMRAGALIPVLVSRQHAYWRLVSGAFLHGSVLHLFVNMYSLWIVGRFVEVVAGSRQMAIIYGVSLLGASLAIVYLGPSFEVTVGASGAIFGLLGAMFAIGLKMGEPGKRLVRANLHVLILNLLITFLVPGISKLGHIGGLVTGFVLTFLIFHGPQRIDRTAAPIS